MSQALFGIIQSGRGRILFAGRWNASPNNSENEVPCMNRLECQVHSCQHFQNNQCCLAGIQVDGPSARESSQTCCASYEERRPGCGQNAMGQNPSVETDIACKVKGCAHNQHDRCQAQNVCVGCCCGDVSSKSGTECRTFQNK